MHYETLLRNMELDGDSIFEPCTILKYDPKTMLAEVQTHHSKQHRQDVPVSFPSMYLNTGIISPPAQESTAILFWGANNQPHIIPAYFLPPAVEIGEDGIMRQTGSPGRIDSSLGTDTVEGGETLIKSLGHAYIHVKNIGEVDIGTSQLHRLFLNESDGSFNAIVERLRQDTGAFQSYCGPVTPGAHDHHIHMKLSDTVPEWFGTMTDQDLINGILGQSREMADRQFSPIFDFQMGNVYDDLSKIKSAVDGSDLFARGVLYKKDGSDAAQQLLEYTLSKLGSGTLNAENDRYVTNIQLRIGGMTMTFTDKQASNPDDRVRTYDFGF